ncbi:hypothetical protein AB0J90_31175 [Micromonospora sp. NPDC049523]|uniref:hypothetical protein n=1 Tax=Micromonospora sp. NPDC049523 TaxID=3155921 RepID=UPI0034142C7B
MFGTVPDSNVGVVGGGGSGELVRAPEECGVGGREIYVWYPAGELTRLRVAGRT